MTGVMGFDGYCFSRRVNAAGTDYDEFFSHTTVALTVPADLASFTFLPVGYIDNSDYIGLGIRFPLIDRVMDGTEVLVVHHITHGAGLESDVMTYQAHVWDNGVLIGFDYLVIWMGGDPLPPLGTVADYNAWQAGAEGFYQPITAGLFAPDTPVFWEQFDIDPLISGTDAAERLDGTDFGDRIDAGDGADTVVGGTGNDTIYGGASLADLRDVIYGGDGDDWIDGGYGNDNIRGDGGSDILEGGFGADTLIGGLDADTLGGSALSDQIFGGDGDDYLNGGFGFDRLNGGTGADRFYHLGVAGHGSDWVQDYQSAEGDVLLFGNASATRSQFQINWANTPGAGSADLAEAFIVYRPTGQILWALVDGAANEHIWLRIGATTYDLLLDL